MPLNSIITSEVNGNSNYIKYAKIFLSSLAANAPKEKVRLSVSGWSGKDIKDAERRNPQAEIDPIEVNKRINTDGQYISVENYIRIVHIQGTVVRLALEDGYDRVAHFDVDTIIRKNLDKLWEGVTPDSLKILKRDSQPPKRRFQNGVYIVGNSENSLKMIRKFERKIINSLEWYEDQRLLWNVFSKSGMNHIQLSEKYNDRRFNEGSFIWHCCRKNKTVHQAWNKEFNKYG